MKNKMHNKATTVCHVACTTTQPVYGVRLLKLFEAAKMLGISLNTLKGILRRGDIATVSIGKRERIPFASLRSFANIKPAKEVA